MDLLGKQLSFYSFGIIGKWNESVHLMYLLGFTLRWKGKFSYIYYVLPYYFLITKNLSLLIFLFSDNKTETCNFYNHWAFLKAFIFYSIFFSDFLCNVIVLFYRWLYILLLTVYHYIKCVISAIKRLHSSLCVRENVLYIRIKLGFGTGEIV